MSTSVIALYPNFDAASRAVDALVDAGFDRKNISIVANDADQRYSSQLQETTAEDNDVKPGQGAGFGAVVGGLIGLGVALIPGIGPVLAAGPLAAAVMAGVGVVAGAATGGIAAGLIHIGVPEEDAQRYEEGVRRGGALVTIELDNEAHVARAQSIMNNYDPLNISEEGSLNRIGAADMDTSTQPQSRNTNQTMAQGAKVGDQQKLQVVEENLNVGKREVQDGTVRVHTRVTEHPVEEQVQLHDEKVVVERRPVDRPASSADLNTFQEGTIELTEKHEEPVVSKTAHVVEEVVVGKQAQDRTETVRDTVRRKDVDVEGASTGTYADYETRFRNDYTTNYGNVSGATWETYSPAYQYGYQLANDPRYADSDWDQIEADARTNWNDTNPNTWDKFKNAIHNAWDEVRGRD